MKFTWKIGGEAGFGIMTTGLIFSKIALRHGYQIHDFVEYPSLIRGGHNTYEVTVSNRPISAPKYTIDLLVCLNEDTYLYHKKRLTPQSWVIYDKEEFELEQNNIVKIDIPFSKILTDLQGAAVMKNMIALGSSLALIGADLKELKKILSEEFSAKSQAVVEFNQSFAEKGYQEVRKRFPSLIKSFLLKQPAPATLALTGNDAFSLASVIAQCGFYCAYPMTPSSSVLTNLASWQDKTGMIVRHSEDEIAVINTALGSAFAGMRSSVGTSGGGFALMVEAISLAGITETPVVIFLAQRPGPATGMPTWTEQGDLLFTIFSGHGEFPKIVLAPGDVEEMLKIAAEAYNLADIYQTPVIILSEMFLSESHQSLAQKTVVDFWQQYQVKRGKLVDKLATVSYKRYQITQDGISPRLIPGVQGYYYQANSYEHLEDGHTTEIGEERKKQVDKRNAKILTYLKQDFCLPKIYGDFAQAELVLVGWGGTKGVLLEAQRILTKKNTPTALIHFTYLYPLDGEKLRPLLTAKKNYLLVENNSTAQLGKLIKMEVGVEIKNKLLKYDGRMFFPEEIVNFAEKKYDN